jgi:integrase
MATGRLAGPRGATRSGHDEESRGPHLPVHAALEKLLKNQQAEHDRLKKAGRIIALVFHRNGTRIKNLRKAWTTACTTAGCPGRIPHDFRRTAVRNLEPAGVLRDAATKIDNASGTISGTTTSKDPSTPTAQSV